FLALIGATFFTNARTRKVAKRVNEWGDFLRALAFGLDAALVGYLVAGFFVTVLYYPFFWMNLSMTAAAHCVTRRAAARARASGSASRVPPNAPSLVRPVQRWASRT